MTIAEEVVSVYFQSWGLPIERKIGALNKAVEAAGIKATFFQDEKGHGWNGESEAENERARAFRAELDKCWPLGRYENEVAAVEKLITEYQSR